MSTPFNQQQIFQSIGQMIAEEGKAVRMLLSKFGIKVKSDSVKDFQNSKTICIWYDFY